MLPAHALPADDVARRFGTDPQAGLAPAEADARLARVGENALPPPKRETYGARLLRHLREPMSILLVAAAAVSGIALGERTDAAAILAIVVLNAVIGVVQEGRAARALDALRRLETPVARVLRGGRVMVVPAPRVVPGDVVLIVAGDRVPADLRLFETTDLEIDESLLTGEALPVEKDATHLSAEDAPVAERPSMAFSGTVVTRGAGRGIVVATGPRTEFGAIASSLERPEPPTPVQRELAILGVRLGVAAGVIAVTVFIILALRAETVAGGVEAAFLAAVALAVAAVPEGLPTVITVALALGVRRMAARGAIVRRLPSVETLGSTTVLCTDKTGTLTENRLRVESVTLADGTVGPPSGLPPAAAEAFATVAALCNDATLDPPSGDPLEIALLEAVGSERVEDLRRRHPRLGAAPFSSERKRMATAHPGLLCVKGAPEVVLGRCARMRLADGTERILDEATRELLLRRAADDASRGTRVLLLAWRPLETLPHRLEEAEVDLTCVALASLLDPVRPEAARAVAEAQGAGIRVVMVTGDHAGTAAWVADRVGLRREGGRVVTGEELRRSGLPEDPLAVPVYARVDPEQKLALVEALRARGHVVAVTGDGVNDAPALKRADIGIAMGRTGTDVAREAADLVITDDNLATIVAAVREGRGIYDDIRKVMEYLIAGNLSEILVVLGALAALPDLGVPLLPLQLLWINLLTDGIPALALGVDPPHAGLMRRPPRSPAERLLSGSRIAHLGVRALLIGGAALASLFVERYLWGEPWPHARGVMFTVLVVGHLLYAYFVHSGGANPWLHLGVGSGLALQASLFFIEPTRRLFGLAPLLAREWALLAIAGATPVALLAAGRAFSSRLGARAATPR